MTLCPRNTTKTDMYEQLEAPLSEIDFPQLYQRFSSSRKVALARIEALCPGTKDVGDQECGIGLASPLVSLLKDATNTWLESIAKEKGRQIAYTEETKILLEVLGMFVNITRLDKTLAEELAKSGSHFQLSRIINVNISSIIVTDDNITFEQEEDSLSEIQDLACEIAYCQNLPFPVKISHFTRDELRDRLPLKFTIREPLHLAEIGDQINVLVHQVTDRQSAQDDVGFGKSLLEDHAYQHFYSIPNLI